MSDDRWRSPLGTRYASPAMQTLWGEPHRIALWRRLWLALAEAERELGLAIPEQALAEMRAHLDDADLAAAARYERRFRHDVMAHVHAFGEQAPAARPFLHLGATSAFVTDNADLLVMRDGLRIPARGNTGREQRLHFGGEVQRFVVERVKERLDQIGRAHV